MHPSMIFQFQIQRELFIIVALALRVHALLQQIYDLEKFAFQLRFEIKVGQTKQRITRLVLQNLNYSDIEKMSRLSRVNAWWFPYAQRKQILDQFPRITDAQMEQQIWIQMQHLC